jgi:cysteinyl-tRNA synthetase
VDALEADLDLPNCLATVREAVRAKLPHDERRWLVLDADAVLGLDLHRVWDSAREAARPVTLSAPRAELLAARSAARQARDFRRADALRAELLALGIEVVDQPDGTTTWRPAARR